MDVSQDLLDRHGSVDRLARRLLVDPDSAEDLAQEIRLAWLRRPPSSPDAARSWLRATARNLAYRWHRGEGGRRHREGREPGEREVIAPDQLVAHGEVRRLVVEALRSLREPYRSTLELRFFEGLSHADISRRLDVQPNALKKRMSRGIEMMREKLDAISGGDRRHWVGALAASLAAPASESSSAREIDHRGSRSPFSVALRLRGVASIAAATAVGLIAWWAWPDAGGNLEGSTDTIATAVPPAAESEKAVAGEALARDAERVPLRAAEESVAKLATWEGTIFDYDGTPEAGGEISLALPGAVFSLPPTQGGTRTGEEFDAEPQFTARADQAGCFRLSDVPLGTYAVTLRFHEAAGDTILAARRVRWGEITFAVPETVHRDVNVLAAGHAVVPGIVIDESTGSPLTGSAIELQLINSPGSNAFFRTRVDPRDGTFLFRCLPPETYDLSVLGPGGFNCTLEGVVSPAPGSVAPLFTVTIPPRGRARVDLESFAEEALARLRLTFLSESGRPLTMDRPRADDSWEFAVGALEVTLEGAVGGSVTRTLEITEGEETTVVLRPSDLLAGLGAEVFAVEGVLRNADGSPAAGLFLEVGSPRGGVERPFRPAGWTDARGRFRLRAMPPGEAALSCFRLEVEDLEPVREAGNLAAARRPYSMTCLRGISIPDDPGPRFRLELQVPSGRVAGVLVDEETGAPLAAGSEALPWMVRLHRAGGQGLVVADVAGDAGRTARFEASGIAAGRYYLEVNAFGFRRIETRPFEVIEGEAFDLGEIRLELVGSAELEVVDGDGAPIPEYMVIHAGRDVNPLWELPTGRVSVWVIAAGFRHRELTLQLRAGIRERVRVVLERD